MIPLTITSPNCLRDLDLLYDDQTAKGYQPVLGSLRSKLLFCTLLRLISQYLKQNWWVFASFLLLVLPIGNTGPLYITREQKFRLGLGLGFKVRVRF